ncbi:hypothetical protein RX327_20050 [Bradyrhizobium sp. BEA-2-5]|uniref:hypothetical protein n=1 Tax=Bradyrhizobium sp. BEA-2-5 TaxID=3080015 RepID=UPI00293E1E82|nr:hypothetical protein [Bradyrhizobium sp. BEA-2-5]WOH78262.1 hypothetical protein RX327_20050 [Bradyrhizobium sp. BEA-2-5]
MTEVNSDLDLRRHHRRARKAPVAAFTALGREHAAEDALAVFSGLTLADRVLVHALQRQRMADRCRRLTDAGISEDRIAAWVSAHAVAFAARVREIAVRVKTSAEEAS